MAYAGADGITRTEMVKALHYVSDEVELHLSFAALQQSLQEITKESARDGVAVGVLFVICTILLFIYPLNKRATIQMADELAERRRKLSTEPAMV